ncbi:MAG: DMT family transporter [Chloroflexi bacterium]|nr:MAG: DMT family transporter [Chloroflexota bacterium]
MTMKTSNVLPPMAASACKQPSERNKHHPTIFGRFHSGLFWALISPLFLGVVPIFAKIAYAAGVPVFTVVALRTVIAASLLWLGMFIFGRHYIPSSTPAILSSLIAGGINGIGSLFFYTSLSRIDASLGQLINISYLIFVTVFLRLIGQKISPLTMIRTFLAILAIYLLTTGSLGTPDWLGVGMMFVAAMTYAVQLVLSQRIMIEIPAPTMTLYAMTAMAGVVLVAWLFSPSDLTQLSVNGWEAVLLMALATALSRLTLFLGVKGLGSIQTALLGVSEVLVSLGLAAIFLHERLTWIQWIGTAVLLISIFLVRLEKDSPRFVDWWKLYWKRRIQSSSPHFDKQK